MIANLTTIAADNLLPLIIALIIGVATGWWAWARYRADVTHDIDLPVDPVPVRLDPVHLDPVRSDPEPIAVAVPKPVPVDVPVAASVGLLSLGIPAAIGAADDLIKIKGIGPKLNSLLNNLGVSRFDQIAAWGPAEIDKVDDHLGEFKDRIGREEWVPQARLLAAGDHAEWQRIYGTAKAAEPKAGAAPAMLAIGIPAAAGAPDNLLQIKGIGPKLYALLTGLGITRFDQIASWGSTEIDKVDDHLGSFKTRIERDAWVEQAGLLARGAIAEFEAKFGKLDSENK